MQLGWLWWIEVYWWGAPIITPQKSANADAQILYLVVIGLYVVVNLAVAAAQAVRALRLELWFLILVFEDAFLGGHLRQVVFQAKIIDLATFFVEFVLAEEDNTIIGTSALVLDLNWVHDALWIYDEVDHARLPRNLKL